MGRSFIIHHGIVAAHCSESVYRRSACAWVPSYADCPTCPPPPPPPLPGLHRSKALKSGWMRMSTLPVKRRLVDQSLSRIEIGRANPILNPSPSAALLCEGCTCDDMSCVNISPLSFHYEHCEHCLHIAANSLRCLSPRNSAVLVTFISFHCRVAGPHLLETTYAYDLSSPKTRPHP